MTDAKKSVEAASAAPGERRSASRPLQKASESGLPDVQKLLGDRHTAQQNGDRDAEAQADAALAELGFE